MIPNPMRARQMQCPDCGSEIIKASQKFCGSCGAPLTVQIADKGKMQKRILDEVWEAGKEYGRKGEQKREARETMLFLWVSILLGAMAGGIIGAQTTEPSGNSALRMVAGIIIGGLLGGLHHIFGCFLAIVIFIFAIIGVATYIL